MTVVAKVRTVIFEKEKNCSEDIVHKVEVETVSKQSIPQSDDIADMMKVTSEQNQQPSTECNNDNCFTAKDLSTRQLITGFY